MGNIPSREAEFVEWSGNLIDVSKNHKVEWGLPEDKLSGLETLHGEVKAPHEKCQTASYTKVDIQEKKEKRDPLKKKEEEFARFHLQNNDKKYWQLLPLGVTSWGDSPYMSFSAFAINPYYIDLDALCDQGLLEKREITALDWGQVPIQRITRFCTGTGISSCAALFPASAGRLRQMRILRIFVRKIERGSRIFAFSWL